VLFLYQWLSGIMNIVMFCSFSCIANLAQYMACCASSFVG
jgi:hypothetical protein